MVNPLIAWSVAHRLLVVLSALVLSAGAIAAALRAPLDVFPEFAPPIVDVQTEAIGLGTADVEALVTTPLEQALAALPGVESMRSTSTPGLSVLSVQFEYGVDPYRARQWVAERLPLAAEQLPPEARPAVAPVAAALTTVLTIGLRGDRTLSPFDLRDLAQWMLRPRLLAVVGVADVLVYGGDVREVAVTATPERLWAHGATLDDVVAAVQGADASAGSGFVDRSGQRLPVWVAGRPRGPGDYAVAPVVATARPPVALDSVASVEEAPAQAVGDARVNGDPGVVLRVIRQPDVDVIRLTRELEAALAAARHALPPAVRVEPAMVRQASFIEHAIGNLSRALLVGAVLVTIVLLLFLGDARAALVSVVAMPLSLLSAVALLRALGATINVMVLGGLAIAVGEVVDDAIIDVENAWRRLRGAPPGSDGDRVVVAALVEVRSAVVYATLIVALVFVPVFLLSGVPGALFRPLATAYVLATLASLAVALTVTPALSAALLPSAVAARPRDPRLVRRLRALYRGALARSLDLPGAVAAVALLALAVAVAVTPLLRLEFLPEFHETDFAMHMTGAPGVGLDESARVGAAVARDLLAIPGVESVAQIAGRAPLSEDPWQAERSELMVRLAADADAERATEAARGAVAGIAGFAFDLKQFLNERIEELLGGSGAQIVVRLRGGDLSALERAAGDVATRIAAIPGAVDVHTPGVLGAPTVRVEPRRFDLLRYGLSAAALQRAMRAAFGGLVVGRVASDDRRANVVVHLDAASARDPERLAALPIATGSAGAVSLGTVADVAIGPIRSSIAHEDGVPTIAIRLDAAGRPLADVAHDAESVLSATALPAGVYGEVGGEYAAARAAERQLVGIGALCLVGILILLLADFGSLALSLLALVNTPLAFVGGIVAIALGAGGRLSLGAIVGFVTVFGITIRNGIVLIAHFEQEAKARGRALDRAEIVAAAADRLGPILMTALVAGLALLPLLALGGRPGGEIEQPLALVVVGGLASSTLLNLFVVPAAYRVLRREAAAS